MGAGGAAAAAVGPRGGGVPDRTAAEALLLGLSDAPDALLRESPEIAAAARTAAEALYADLAAHQQESAVACPELYTAGFDTEQIWYQIELQLSDALKRVKKILRSVEKGGQAVQLLTGDDAVDDDAPGSEDDEELLVEDGDDLAAEEEDEDEEEAGADDVEDDGDEDEDGDGEGDEADEDEDAPRRRPRHTVEDDFFRLDDMERFVGDAEAQAGRDADEDEQGTSGRDADGDDVEEGDDEDDVDLFSADAGGGGGGVEAAIALSRSLVAGAGGAGGKGKGKGKKGEPEAEADGDVFYEEFFGARPRGGGGAGGRRRDAYTDHDDAEPADDEQQDGDEDGDAEDEDEDAEEGGARRQRGKGAGTSGRKGQLLGPDDGDEEVAVEGMGGRPLTAHQKRQAKLQEHIDDLERQNLGDKEWFMRGEVRAGDRPLNSALEVDMDFEHAQMPAPVITEEVTKTLEDIIKARVVEARWDDPQRKLPPAPVRGRKLLELSEEKSKKGLGELYEDDFVKQQQQEARAAAQGAAGDAAAAASGLAAPAEEDTEAHKEVKTLWGALSAKLDALSHFVYAPKPILEEMTVRADVPAIALEEVAPGTASTAALRAPEEVFRGVAAGAVAGGVRGSAAGQLRGAEEFTKEERKAARAKKKRKGRAAKAEVAGLKEKRRKVSDAANAVAEAAGFKAKKELGTATTMGKKGDRSEFAKSSKVFAKLQDAAEGAKAAAAAGGGKAVKAKKKEPLAGGGSARLKL